MLKMQLPLWTPSSVHDGVTCGMMRLCGPAAAPMWGVHRSPSRKDCRQRKWSPKDGEVLQVCITLSLSTLAVAE